MKKKIPLVLTLLMILVSACCLVSCGISEYLKLPGLDNSTTDAHVHDWGDWESDATGHHRICAICGESSEDENHEITILSAISPTCGKTGLTEGEVCSVCNYVIEAQSPVPATGEHDSLPCDFVLPTLTTEGCVSGERCTICGTVTDGEQILPAYETTCGTYAYHTLESRTNGTQMQAFYRALYSAAAAFHESDANATQNGSDNWVAFTISYEDYSLTSDEAFTVLKALKTDCPIFWWLGNKMTSLGKVLSVLTEEEYANGNLRTTYNNAIYEGIAELGYRSGSDYDLALFLHDTIIRKIDYAYQEDGVTPETDAWAHSILGYFITGTGVCETYAETCHLILNYWGVENVIVSGTAGGVGHAWNMIRVDDAGWYWFDLTWDDQPHLDFGRVYQYFCKTSSEFKLAERTVDTEYYTLPTPATLPFTDHIIDTTFVNGHNTYTIVGYGEAELNYVDASGAVTVPAQVAYGDNTYRVVSVGCVEDTTLITVFASGVTSVFLPETVQQVRGNAFSVRTLTSVTIDDANPYLFAEEKAIYTKNPCVLVCYLLSAQEKTFSLYTNVVGIASFAIMNDHVEKVVLPNSLQYIENSAFCYCPANLVLQYNGTRSEFFALRIETNALPTCTIICTDGSIASR